MGWSTGELVSAAAATVVAALLLAGGARWAAAVRQRRHRELIADALERMSAQMPKPRLRTLARDVTEVLARQDRVAAALRAKRTPDAGHAADLALLISVEAVTAVETMRVDQVDDSVWTKAAVAPSVGEHPQLREITERLGRSSVRLVDLGRAVLAEGDRLGLSDEEARGSLAAALEQARLAVHGAACGDQLKALAALTTVHIPVPETGFPGQVAADELRVQVNALARLGIRHRAALADHLAAHREAKIQEEPR